MYHTYSAKSAAADWKHKNGYWQFFSKHEIITYQAKNPPEKKTCQVAATLKNFTMRKRMPHKAHTGIKLLTKTNQLMGHLPSLRISSIIIIAQQQHRTCLLFLT